MSAAAVEFSFQTERAMLSLYSTAALYTSEYYPSFKMSKRRNVLRSQARQMVHDVLTFMKNEAQEGLQFELKAVCKRTAVATGVSERTVSRIAATANAPGASMHEVFRTPGKKRAGKRSVTAISSTNLGVIKRCIHNFHITEKELPNINLLLKKLTKLVNFQGKASSMRRVITDLGFRWKRTDDNRKILIENVGIRQKRIEYIQAIIINRSEGRPVVFADATYVHTTRREAIKGPKKKERIAVIHAATDAGFLPNTLLTFRTTTKSEDNKQFDRWIRSQLIPNMPVNAVLAVGRASFFNRAEDAAPTATSNRPMMEAWLLEKGIPYYSTMLKPQLFRLISTYKPGFRHYKIDGILNENNHPVIRLPSHHPDLNPFEEVWPAIRHHIEGKAKDVETAKTLIQEKAAEINEQIAKLCRNIQGIEKEYKESDVTIDKLTDDVAVQVSDNESDEESEDSGSDDEQDESSSDEELIKSKEPEVMEVTVSPDAILA